MRSAKLYLGLFAVLGLSLIGTMPMTASANGNSAAAHACQKGGYLGLVGSNGETFTNVGECVSFSAQGGQFATDGIIIPAGKTITLDAPLLSACNELTYGYEINFGADDDLGSKPYGCFDQAEDNVTIGPFATAVILRLYLIDHTCGDTVYYSDGDHARLTPTATGYTVDIVDGGGFCEATNTPREPGVTGNLNVDVVIS